MSTMLSTVSSDHLVVTTVTAHRERDLQDVVATLHQHQDTLHFLPFVFHAQAAFHLLHQLVLGDLTGAMEEVLHHVEEAGVLRSRHVLELVGYVVQAADLQERRGAGLHELGELAGRREDTFRHGLEVKHRGEIGCVGALGETDRGLSA